MLCTTYFLNMVLDMPASFPVNCLHAVTVYQSAKMGLKRRDPDTSFTVSVS